MTDDAYTEGLKIRKAVLGAEYVNRALSNLNSFNRPLQELVTEYCWGKVWGRPGLDRRQRSMRNLAMISILNRPHELKAHIRYPEDIFTVQATMYGKYHITSAQSFYSAADAWVTRVPR